MPPCRLFSILSSDTKHPSFVSRCYYRPSFFSVFHGHGRPLSLRPYSSKANPDTGHRPASEFLEGSHSVRTCGIVGLPNIGKSTLFNALTASWAAEAANYPFCTIEPNVGRVQINEPKLTTLAALAKSAKVVPLQLEFVDIAGLVKGASEGQGMGNKFLSHVRGVNMLVHLVRCFDDPNIVHVDATIDPLKDISVINDELIFADLASIEKKTAIKKNKQDTKLAALLSKTAEALESGTMVKDMLVSEEEYHLLKPLQLLTLSPTLYVCNVAEEDVSSGNKYTELIKEKYSNLVVLSAKVEAEIANIEDEEAKLEFRKEFGSSSGLLDIAVASQALLRQQTYYTVGPQETHAWSIPFGSTARQAAGVIHSDFYDTFISAETVAYQDYVECGGEEGAKEAGKMRLEGPNYVCQPDDIFTFRFNKRAVSNKK